MTLLLLLRSGTLYTRTVTDNAGATDAVTFAVGRSISIVDSEGITDSVISGGNRVLTFTDSLGMSDIAGVFNYFDVVGLTDTISFTVSSVITDTLAGTDINTSSSGKNSTITDLIAGTDAITSNTDHVLVVVDSSLNTDSKALNFSTNLVTDSLSLTDPFVAPVPYSQSVADTSGLTDILSVALNAVFSLTVTDSAGLTDSANGTASKFFTVNDVLAGTDTATSSQGYFRSAVDSAGLVDAFSSVYSAPTAYTQSVVDTLAGTDVATSSSSHVISIVDLEAGTDTFSSAYNHTALGFAQSIGALTDTLTFAKVITLSITDDAGLDTSISKTAHRGSSGRVLQMVEYINRMED